MLISQRLAITFIVNHSFRRRPVLEGAICDAFVSVEPIDACSPFISLSEELLKTQDELNT